LNWSPAYGKKSRTTKKELESNSLWWSEEIENGLGWGQNYGSGQEGVAKLKFQEFQDNWDPYNMLIWHKIPRIGHQVSEKNYLVKTIRGHQIEQHPNETQIRNRGHLCRIDRTEYRGKIDKTPCRMLDINFYRKNKEQSFQLKPGRTNNLIWPETPPKQKNDNSPFPQNKLSVITFKGHKKEQNSQKKTKLREMRHQSIRIYS